MDSVSCVCCSRTPALNIELCFYSVSQNVLFRFADFSGSQSNRVEHPASLQTLLGIHQRMDPSKQPPAMGQAGGPNRQGSMGQELDLGLGYRWFYSAHNPFTVYTKLLCDVQSSQNYHLKKKKNQWTVFSICACDIWMLLINSGRFWCSFESLWLSLPSLCFRLLKPVAQLIMATCVEGNK